MCISDDRLKMSDRKMYFCPVLPPSSPSNGINVRPTSSSKVVPSSSSSDGVTVAPYSSLNVHPNAKGLTLQRQRVSSRYVTKIPAVPPRKGRNMQQNRVSFRGAASRQEPNVSKILGVSSRSMRQQRVSSRGAVPSKDTAIALLPGKSSLDIFNKFKATNQNV